MANTLESSTKGLHEVAPNLSQALQMVGSRALGFLHQQMPKPSTDLIGDQEFEPSKSSQRKWMDLHDLISNPISVLDHVRHGTLTSDHMNALETVHPELLDDMREKVIGEMKPDRVKALPSSTKRSLGMFLGNPISSTATPQAMMANQMALQSIPQPQSSGPSSVKSTLGGMKQLHLGTREATEVTQLDETEE